MGYRGPVGYYLFLNSGIINFKKETYCWSMQVDMDSRL